VCVGGGAGGSCLYFTKRNKINTYVLTSVAVSDRLTLNIIFSSVFIQLINFINYNL
jgi:hypothetical protein